VPFFGKNLNGIIDESEFTGVATGGIQNSPNLVMHKKPRFPKAKGGGIQNRLLSEG